MLDHSIRVFSPLLYHLSCMVRLVRRNYLTWYQSRGLKFNPVWIHINFVVRMLFIEYAVETHDSHVRGRILDHNIRGSTPISYHMSCIIRLTEGSSNTMTCTQ
jgi:hypothetical protein